MHTWGQGQKCLSLAFMEKQSKNAEPVISNFRRPEALLPAWVWLHWVEQGDVHNGWPVEPPQGVGGLFLGFGVNPVLLFWSPFPLPTIVSLLGSPGPTGT